MPDRGGLGRGLSSIFGTDVTDMLENIQNGQEAAIEREQLKIPVNAIRPNPYQPRKVFDEKSLQELSASIKEHGVFTPILVKKSVQGYDLIAGERRLRASRMAGLAEIPAILVDFTDQEMMEIALLENIQREDLNVIEEAKAYEKLIQSYSYTQEQLARRVGKSREHITNTMRLLKLPADVQELAVEKKLSMGHIRALLGLKDEEAMRSIARQAISQGLSVRKVEQLVKEHTRRVPAVPEENLYLKDAQRQLEDFFQTPVKIGPSSITIRYTGDGDLTRILELLGQIEEQE